MSIHIPYRVGVTTFIGNSFSHLRQNWVKQEYVEHSGKLRGNKLQENGTEITLLTAKKGRKEHILSFTYHSLHRLSNST